VGRYEVATYNWSHVYSTHGAGVLFEVEDDQLVRYFRMAGRLVAADRIAAPSDLSLARYSQPGNQPDWPPAGTTVYYHADYLGSTRLVTDQAGDPLRYLRHDAWGETLAVYQVQPDGSVETQLITGSGNRWGFTGQRDEPGQGLVDFGRRWYDPATRQFLSPDPEGQFANPRAYGPWDPLNGSDPDGGFFFSGLPLALNWALTSGIVNFAITATQTGDLGAGLQAGMMGAMTGALGATGIQGALLKPLFTAAALGNATAATALQATFALASVANSAARGDIAGVFLFVGGAAFGETSLSAKSAQLEQRSLAAAQEVGMAGAGGSQSGGPRTDVTYGYTDTPVGGGTNHVVVIGTDPRTGESYATRAGPALGRGDGGALTIYAMCSMSHSEIHHLRSILGKQSALSTSRSRNSRREPTSSRMSRTPASYRTSGSRRTATRTGSRLAKAWGLEGQRHRLGHRDGDTARHRRDSRIWRKDVETV
jgi:RHS repeat-associated protein